VLCEACVEIRENEKSVAKKTESLHRPEPLAVTMDDEDEGKKPARKKGPKPEVIQVSIIAICAVVLIARATLFGGSNDQPVDTNQENLAQMQMLSSLAQCMVLFQQIGESLAAGDLPDRNTTCPGSNQPPVIRQTADDVLVEHPEPDLFGYAGIVVSRSNPVPRIVQ